VEVVVGDHGEGVDRRGGAPTTPDVTGIITYSDSTAPGYLTITTVEL
jgi:hypothetical protein